MKAGVGYTAFFSFIPLFGLLPVLPPSTLDFSSIVSRSPECCQLWLWRDDSHQEGPSQPLEATRSYLGWNLISCIQQISLAHPTTQGLAALPQQGNIRMWHLPQGFIFQLWVTQHLLLRRLGQTLRGLTRCSAFSLGRQRFVSGPTAQELHLSMVTRDCLALNTAHTEK